jgi:hypothetical protein
MFPEQQKTCRVIVWPFQCFWLNQGILLSKLNCYEGGLNHTLITKNQRIEMRYPIQSITPAKKFRHCEVQSSSGLNTSSTPFSDIHWWSNAHCQFVVQMCTLC